MVYEMHPGLKDMLATFEHVELWHVEIENIKSVTCYLHPESGKLFFVIQFPMDEGCSWSGFDVAVPVTESNKVHETISSLSRYLGLID